MDGLVLASWVRAILINEGGDWLNNEEVRTLLAERGMNATDEFIDSVRGLVEAETPVSTTKYDLRDDKNNLVCRGDLNRCHHRFCDYMGAGPSYGCSKFPETQTIVEMLDTMGWTCKPLMETTKV